MPEVPVALCHCDNYESRSLREAVFKTLEAARIPLAPGMRVLVKPNLLMARRLACASPRLVALACEWLLGQGLKLKVADSPGFGSAKAVASQIGLEKELEPLGLKVEQLDQARRVELPLDAMPVFMVSRHALESDLILSVPRVKAHAQMRMTLSVKNCFGCVSSLRKAFAHARYGADRNFFADCLAALWAALPPVAALADGILAMHVTGPSKGRAFQLGLIGASFSAPALDSSILKILHVDPETVPLAMALARRARAGDLRAEPLACYPLDSPDDFNVNGFIVPSQLLDASFNPFHLARSLARRVWAVIKKPCHEDSS